MAIDGLPQTVWSAGNFAPQSIEIQLAHASIVGGIRLTVSQFPRGQTSHLAYAFNGNTMDQQVLTRTAAAPVVGVEAVKIETVLSSSFVAWREIEILSADPGTPVILKPMGCHLRSQSGERQTNMENHRFHQRKQTACSV